MNGSHLRQDERFSPSARSNNHLDETPAGRSGYLSSSVLFNSRVRKLCYRSRPPARAITTTRRNEKGFLFLIYILSFWQPITVPRGMTFELPINSSHKNTITLHLENEGQQQQRMESSDDSRRGLKRRHYELTELLLVCYLPSAPLLALSLAQPA